MSDIPISNIVLDEILTKEEMEDVDRFKLMDPNDLNNFLENFENANTKTKTKGDLKLFSSYLRMVKDEREIHTIPPEELNEHLVNFIVSVRKKNGDEYEPGTLTSYICSIDKHLRKHNYPNSITDSKDVKFSKTRDVLKKKHRQLRTLGKGNKPNAADAISDQELETFYKTKQLGPYNGYSLINSLWLMCSVHFGMRTGKEIHDLMWGDVELKIDDEGKEYLIYDTERQTKTRTGNNPRDVRILKPRAYATPEFPDRNPVALYKLYSDQRPESMCQPDSPFFLSVNAHGKPGSKWFKSQPLGVNKVYSIMKDMKIGAGLQTDKNLTNYSARKHLVQKLSDSGVPPNQIVQVTGHKNVNSLNNYSKMNENQQQNVSCILSNTASTNGCKKSLDSVSNMSSQHLQDQTSSANSSVGFAQLQYQQLSSIFQGSTLHIHNFNMNLHSENSHSRMNKENSPVQNQAVETPSLSPPRKYRRIKLFPDSDSE